MGDARWIYAIFIIAALGLNLAIGITPWLAFQNSPLASSLYHDVFVYFCHQKISRSLCLFEGPDGFFIADCLPQEGMFVPDDRTQTTVVRDGIVGHKLPVCSRDIAIYLGILLAGMAYPFFYCIGICKFQCQEIFAKISCKLKNREVPDPLYLVMALIPMAVDGGLQLVSDIGFSVPGIGLYESTNLKRLLTGFIAGAVVPVYLLPILNRMFAGKNEVTEGTKTKGRASSL